MSSIGISVGIDRLGPVIAATSYDSATTTLLAAMSVQPSAARASVINDAIVALKAQSLWTKMGLLYVTAAHDEQAGRVNWVNPGTATLTAVNSPTFTTDRGFAGDGVTSYLDTGTAQNATSQYSQNAAHLGIWGVTAGTAGKNVLGKTANGTSTCAIQTNNVNGFAVQVNGGGSIFGLDSPVTTGNVLGVRTDASTVFGYRNGVNIITGTKTSAAPSSENFTILRNATLYADQQIGYMSAGNTLTDTDAANFHTILRTYMTAVGVP